MPDPEFRGVYGWIDDHRREVAGGLAAGLTVGVALHQHNKHKHEAPVEPAELTPSFDEAKHTLYSRRLDLIHTARPRTRQGMLAVIATLVHTKRPSTRQTLCQSALLQPADIELGQIDLAIRHGRDILFLTPQAPSQRKFWIPDESVWWAADEERANEYPDIHKYIANLAAAESASESS